MPASSDATASAFTDLRRALLAAGYTAAALQERLQVHSPDDVGVLNHAPALARLAEHGDPLSALLQLFYLEAPSNMRAVTRAVPPACIAALIHAGVLRRASAGRRSELAARVRLDVVGNQFCFADRRFGQFDRAALHAGGNDPVYPPSSDSLLLRDAVVVPRHGDLLDLCTGSGVQGLQQAAHVRSVIAVDRNPRAVAFARANAQLNGVANFTVRCGDLYAAVAGVQFDAIIANPPFVTSPYAEAPAYHSGGPTGTRVLRRVIDGWRTHLRPGGRAFAISHLGLRDGETVASVATPWLRAFPGRVLVLVVGTGSRIDLAAAQALFALGRGLAAYAREVRHWITYLRRHHIHTIAVLLIAAERGGARDVDIADAMPRVLSLPITASPAQRIGAWLEMGRAPA